MTALLRRTPAAAPLPRRLRSLQVGVGLQGCMLWVPVEKLFQTQIGFDAASIGVMAAAYAAVVPLLEVPTGILADRWSRTGILIMSSVAAAASALVGGLSHNVATYIVAAMILGVYFAMNSGTVDSVVYDTVMEEAGSSDLYETWIGRVRIVESAAFAGSALLGGLIAGWATPRVTYLFTVPFALASVVAFLRFREPQLHRAAERVALRQHVATTIGAMTHIRQVRRMLLIADHRSFPGGLRVRATVSSSTPPTYLWPYWALLQLGLGGTSPQTGSAARRTVIGLAVLLAGAPVLLAASHALLVVALAQTVLACRSRSSASTPAGCCTTPSRPRSAPASPPARAHSRGYCFCRSRWCSVSWRAATACTGRAGC